MSHKKSTAKKAIKRLGRKSFRAAERAAVGGARPRSLRSMRYATPGSMRYDKLPLDGG